MKILQVCSIFPPQPSKFASGVTQVAYHISKELVKRGHSVEVWAANTLDMKTRIDSRSVTVDGIKVHYFPYIARYYTSFLMPSLFNEARCRIGGFDVINIHGFRTFEGTVIAYYAKKRNIPYLLQAYGSLPRLVALQQLKAVYDIICGYRLLENAARVIAVTKMEAEQYKAMGVSEDKIKIIPNGIDLSEFRDLPEKGHFKKEYGLDSNEKLVLYLGRIHKIKSPDLLVEAFAELIRELPDVKLVIAGPDDGYLTTLRGIIDNLGISDKVLVTGHVGKSEKLAAYVDADVYALPSVYDMSPTTVMEACACSIPVIVTDRCGLASWIASYQAGYVVPHDRKQFKQALIAILSDKKLRQQLGNQARRLVEDQFAWNKIAGQIEATYEAVIHNPREANV